MKRILTHIALMKHLYLVFLIAYGITLSTDIYSQTLKIHYEYDEAGNRISRLQLEQIIRKTDNSSAALPGDISSLEPAVAGNEATAASNQKETGVNVVINEEEINLFPNPTMGLMSITMKTFSAQDSGEILIHDTHGRKVYQQKIISGRTDVDLGNEPAGTYLINITVNGETGYYSVVKQ